MLLMMKMLLLAAADADAAHADDDDDDAAADDVHADADAAAAHQGDAAAAAAVAVATCCKDCTLRWLHAARSDWMRVGRISACAEMMSQQPETIAAQILRPSELVSRTDSCFTSASFTHCPQQHQQQDASTQSDSTPVLQHDHSLQVCNCHIPTCKH